MIFKRTFIIILAIQLGLILSFAQDSIKIGFSLGDFDVDRWYKDREYFVEHANLLGAKVLIEYAYSDAGQQKIQIKKLLDDGAKVIVIVPTDARTLGSAIKECNEAGIKVISYDRLIMDCKIDYYISFDNIKVGELQARYVVNQNPKGNYVVLDGPIRDNNAKLFRQGQMNILSPLAKEGKIKILYDEHLSEWSSIASFQQMQLLFTGKLSVDVVVASNDGLASGVIMAMEMEGITNKILITGQDATIEGCQNIVAGTQLMTVYKSLKKLANEAAEMAINIAKNKTINTNGSIHNGFFNVPSILLEPVSVDKENLRATVIKDGFLTEKEIYIE